MIVLLIFVGMLLDTNPSDLSVMIYWRLFRAPAKCHLGLQPGPASVSLSQLKLGQSLYNYRYNWPDCVIKHQPSSLPARLTPQFLTFEHLTGMQPALSSFLPSYWSEFLIPASDWLTSSGKNNNTSSTASASCGGALKYSPIKILNCFHNTKIFEMF